IPLRHLALERAPAEPRQRVIFRAPSELAGLPLGFDPALLFQLVQRGVERAVADLEDIARHLQEPLADRPSMQRLEREDLQQQEVERALNQVGRFAHGLGYRYEITPNWIGFKSGLNGGMDGRIAQTGSWDFRIPGLSFLRALLSAH